MSSRNSPEEAARRHREDSARKEGWLDWTFFVLTHPLLHAGVVGWITWEVSGSIAWSLGVPAVLLGWYALTDRF